jgi:hypothetical protein
MKPGQNLNLQLLKYSKTINLIVFLFLYIIIAILIILKPTAKGNSDYWMHVGSIEIFSQNLASPQHTYDEAEAIRVRNFSPYQAILAILVKMFGVRPVNAFTIGALISVGLLFLGIYLMGDVFGTSLWLPGSLLIAILFFVGTGFDWSEEVYAKILPQTGGYPSTLAVALSLICWYNIDKFLVKKSFRKLCWVTILTALVLLIHQLVFLHFAVFLFFWIILTPSAFRNKLFIFGAITAAFPLVMLWPYFSPFSVSYAAVTGVEHRWDNVYNIKMVAQRTAFLKYKFYKFSSIKRIMGPSLLGILLLPILPERIRLKFIFLVAFTLFMWFVGIKINLPLAGRRWALPAMLLLQFVIGIQIARLIDFILVLDLKQIGRGILSLTMVGFITLIILSETIQIWQKYYNFFGPSHNVTLSWINRWERFSKEAKRHIKLDDLIAADVHASYCMTAFKLRPIVFSRKKNPLNTMLINLYAEDTSMIKRIQILKDLGTQYFIVEPGEIQKNVEKELSSLGEEIFRKDDIILYRVKL